MTVLELVSKVDYLNRLISRMSSKYSTTKNNGYETISREAKVIMRELENCDITENVKIEHLLSKISELYLQGKLLDREERLREKD